LSRPCRKKPNANCPTVVDADEAVLRHLRPRAGADGLARDSEDAARRDLRGGVERPPAAAAGEHVCVRFAGTTKIVSSGTIAAGDRITATTAGKGVTTVTNLKTFVGVALEAGTTSGDICEILLTPVSMVSL
jgi:hypothetical protein